MEQLPCERSQGALQAETCGCVNEVVGACKTSLLSFYTFFNEIRNKDIISAPRRERRVQVQSRELIIFKQKICFFVEPKAIISFV